MKNLLFIIIALFAFQLGTKAQTAKVYRAGTLIGTYSTLSSACAAANTIGDSILLSAHTFKEHDIPMLGGQIWQGTFNSTDTSTIDAESKGRIGLSPALGKRGRACIIRDIICTSGSTVGSGEKSAGGFAITDSLVLRGHSIIRNCYAQGLGGAVLSAYLFDKAKITQNKSDSAGGAGQAFYMNDSSELSYNTAPYGGAVGHIASGGSLYCNSQNVRIHHNTATIAGGAIYGNCQMTGGQITNNQAPLGAAISTIPCYPIILQNVYIYNPRLDGKRQNEINLRSGALDIQGSWFGQSDTAGLIIVGKDYTFCTTVSGKPAKANWSVNWGKILSKKDTLFPIGAAFTYSDGTSLPAKSLPWLQGKFSSSTGKMLTPNPKISASDTMSSLFRTYVYATKGDTSSKPINFVCIVDADTFRSSPRVWGIDSIKLSIEGLPMATNIVVYPNPTSQYLTIRNVPEACQLQLYNINGKLLLNERSNTNTTVLDLASFPRGQYMLKVITAEGKVGAAKLMKE